MTHAPRPFRERLQARLEQCGVPEHLHEGIVEYVAARRAPGQFLLALVRNDLREAVGRADPETLAGLQSLVVFFYNYVTSRCWGSPAAVEAWLSSTEPVPEVCE